jgi:hypothetical protein
MIINKPINASTYAKAVELVKEFEAITGGTFEVNVRCALYMAEQLKDREMDVLYQVYWRQVIERIKELKNPIYA